MPVSSGAIELGEDAGQLHALLLAAGQRGVGALAQRRDTGVPHGALDRLLVLLAGGPRSVRAALWKPNPRQ